MHIKDNSSNAPNLGWFALIIYRVLSKKKAKLILMIKSLFIWSDNSKNEKKTFEKLS